MDSKVVTTFLFGLMDRWAKMDSGKDTREALTLCMTGYTVACEFGDEALRRAFLTCLQQTTRAALDRLDQSASVDIAHCSFCGRHQGEVRLVAGSSANICNECVERISQLLRPEQK